MQPNNLSGQVAHSGLLCREAWQLRSTGAHPHHASDSNGSNPCSAGG